MKRRKFIGDRFALNQSFPAQVLSSKRQTCEHPNGRRHEALRTAREKPALTSRKKAFEAEFKDWIGLQNERFEALGVPGADLRPW